MSYDFISITMKAKSGLTLYLKASNREAKDPHKVICEWTKDKGEAIYFNCPSEAEKFANSYFKNFKNWGLEDIRVSI